jgi:hypothetical protein
MNFNPIRCGCVCPKLCLGEMSGTKFKIFFLKWTCSIRISLSMVSDVVSVVGRWLGCGMDFGVAFVNPLVLNNLTSRWCWKTALLLTNPMKRNSTPPTVPSTDYCHTGRSYKGRPSKGQEMARQGGGDTAQKERTTSGVHQDAFFAPGDPLACRLRPCLSLAARKALEQLEREVARPVRSKRQKAARRRGFLWAEFIHRTDC